MEATATPRPTVDGLMPVPPAVRPTPSSCCPSTSLKAARLRLKAVVLTLATLLPITSMRTWLLLRPETPVRRERIMVVLRGWLVWDIRGTVLGTLAVFAFGGHLPQTPAALS